MSSVDQLIRELSPKGVHHAPLERLAKNLDGRRKPVTRGARTPGDIPYYGASGVVDYVSDYIFDGDFLLVSEDGANLLARSTPIAFSISGKAWVNNHAHVLQFETYTERRFVEIYLNSIDLSPFISGAAQPKLNKANLNRIPIPVPPLEVQREIVRILDQFARMEAELKSELKSELNARRRQYDFYRDKLVNEAVGAEHLRLGDVGNFVRGRRFTKNDMVDSGIPSIHYGEIYTEYSTYASKVVRHVRVELRDQLRYAEPGSVIFAGVGETVEDVGKAVAWLGNESVATHDDTFVFTSSLNPKFVAYAVQTAEFHRQKERHVSRAKVKRLSAAGLADIKIPVPDMIEQERIVETLDKFDALVKEISAGLRAELKARRKQYEHYRDRLFTFKEVAA